MVNAATMLLSTVVMAFALTLASASACNPFSDPDLLHDAATRVQHDIVVEVPGMSPCVYYGNGGDGVAAVWIAVKWDYTYADYTIQSNVIGLSPSQFNIYETPVEDAVAYVLYGLEVPLSVQEPRRSLGIAQELITAAATCIHKNIVIHAPGADSYHSRTSFPETLPPVNLEWNTPGRFGLNTKGTAYHDWHDTQVGVYPRNSIEEMLYAMLDPCDSS